MAEEAAGGDRSGWLSDVLYGSAGRPLMFAAGQVHPALYIVAGTGIVAYGIHLIVLANYRRVEIGA